MSCSIFAVLDCLYRRNLLYNIKSVVITHYNGFPHLFTLHYYLLLHEVIPHFFTLHSYLLPKKISQPFLVGRVFLSLCSDCRIVSICKRDTELVLNVIYCIVVSRVVSKVNGLLFFVKEHYTSSFGTCSTVTVFCSLEVDK